MRTEGGLKTEVHPKVRKCLFIKERGAGVSVSINGGLMLIGQSISLRN
jgi:hypothetical protein